MVPSRIRADGFYLLLLSGLVLAAMCYLLERNARAPMMDFRTAYFSAECLLRHCDPYKQSDVLALYAERADISGLSARDRLVIAGNVYPPSEFAFIILFELLPFQTAQALWFLLIAMSFTVAAAAMFDLAAAHAHRIALALLCFAVVNCQSLIHYANPGAVAVPFCLVAVWCFLRERFVLAGILLLALSLLLKPQDAALIWFYFFIAGGAYRKRALQTLLVAADSQPADASMGHAPLAALGHGIARHTPAILRARRHQRPRRRSRHLRRHIAPGDRQLFLDRSAYL